MADFVTIEKDESTGVTLLRPPDFIERRFKPISGTIAATAVGGLEADKPKVIRRSRGETEIELTPVRIKIELFDPAGARVTGKVITTDNPQFATFEVPRERAGREWRWRFSNEEKVNIVCVGEVRYPVSMHVLETTRIPLRTLNNGLRQFLELLSFRVSLDGRDGQIAFSREITDLTHGALKSKRFDLPDVVNDINLESLSVTFRRSPNGRPAVFIAVAFEEEGRELVLFNTPLGAVGVDVEDLAIDVEIELSAHGRPGDRVVLTQAKVKSHADVLGKINDALEEGIEDALNGIEFRSTVGPYLARGLAQLAARGPDLVSHAFHDITIDGGSRQNPFGRNLLVTHFDPVVRPQLPAGDLRPPEEVPVPRPGTLHPPVHESETNPVELRNLRKINHIVVLMQENRSFDHILGYLRLKEGRTDIEGLTGEESNSAPGVSAHVAPIDEIRCMRDPPVGTGPGALDWSPEHGHSHVKNQVNRGQMDGFLADFRKKYPRANPECVMAYYTKNHLPSYDLFARHFVVCDHWFASHPGATQPNRFYTLTGTAPHLENFPVGDPHLGYLRFETIFEHLTSAGISWAYFEQDVAFLRMFDKFRLDDTNVVPFWDPKDGFLARTAKGKLPAVTFIDPNFVDVPPERTANDDLAPADIARGQANVACIYDALVRSPQWPRILFLLTYDEHGGFFDHVPPPGTPGHAPRPPAGITEERGPTFYGVRVPAFVISPWVGRGRVSKTIFDHTSIIKTIVLRFFPDENERPKLGARVRAANHLGGLLTQARPRSKVPTLDVEGACAPRRPVRPGARPPQKDVDDFRETMRHFGKPLTPT
jgi:phospholipase C